MVDQSILLVYCSLTKITCYHSIKMTVSSELLLELFSEEIPAYEQKNAENEFCQTLNVSLSQANVKYGSINTYSGQRRITIHIDGLPQFISSKEQEIKGPKTDAPDTAIEGFCRSNNTTKNQISTKLIKGQSFYVYVKKTSNTPVSIVLTDIIHSMIRDYTWTKSMRWGNYSIRWIRPIHNILCIFDNKLLPIQFGHLKSNNITYGHRFMANRVIEVNNFQEYKEALQKNYVILSRQERHEIITKQLTSTADKLNILVNDDPELLEEVIGMVEYPVVMFGKIPERFLHLPHEILITSMRTHQKYFSTFDKNGNIAPYFLFVSNISPTEHAIIISGNEKVLSARLSDALYFYDRDISSTLESKLSKLSQVIFHDKLGNMTLKTERVGRICHYIAPTIQNLQIAAKLYKSDLVSEVVGEFPELQGTMGYYYAIADGLGDEVATAIRDHYKPASIRDVVPTKDSSILALADKIDSLVGLMLAGEKATSSKDPYALRRQALGIIRIILENNINLDLNSLIEFTAKLYNQDADKEILIFLEERTKFYLKNHYDIELIHAVLDFTVDSNLAKLKLKLVTLLDFLKTTEGKNVITAYKRVQNILDNQHIIYNVNEEHFTSIYETKLFEELKTASRIVDSAIKEANFNNVLHALAEMLPHITHFFDNVFVKDPDIKIANNRLALLHNIINLFHKVAKFEYI